MNICRLCVACAAFVVIVTALPAAADIVPCAPDPPPLACDRPARFTPPGVCGPDRNQCVPPGGVCAQAPVQRATAKFNVSQCGLCSGDAETQQNLSDCTCWTSTIPQLRQLGVARDTRQKIRYATINPIARTE